MRISLRFISQVLILVAAFCSARAEVVLDVAADYSTNSNPNPIWSYGYQGTLGGAFTPLPYSLIQNYGGNSVVHRWLRTSAGGPPSVQKNIGTYPHISDGGQANIAPGVVWFGPGSLSDDAYCVIRCVIPADGRYRLRTVVSTYLQGPISGDCDFHVLKNGTQLFGEFLPGSSGTSYSNLLQLVTGDIIDFVVGRGADNSSYASGLTIDARLISDSSIPEPPPGLTLDLAKDYSTNQNPGTVWSYGWKSTLDGGFTLLPFPLIQDYGQYGLVHRWLKAGAGSPPSVDKNIGTVNHISDGGQGNIAPGVVWFGPGQEGTPETYGVIRCVIPVSGAYKLETAVHTYLDGPISGDSDFHVVKNGAEIFGQPIPANGGTSYSNTLTLAAGDIIDFAVGRGADNHVYASGLKIAATLKQVPPHPSPILNLQEDYTTNENPNRVWSYGYTATVGGPFSLLPVSLLQNYGPGHLIHRWLKTPAGGPPSVNKNVGTVNSISDGGQGNIPPGVVWFGPGSGSDDAYCVIRCTVPSSDRYSLETAVRTYLDGPISGDSDFHVLKNGTEIFSHAMPGNSATTYSNTLELAAGDTIDFAVGRGADNSSYASGLKIQAILKPTSLVPPPPPPPPPPPTGCAPVSPTGLISWWRAEGNANDSVGSNNGQLINGVTFAPGKVGLGFRLTGGSFVLVPDNPSLDLTGEITVDLWFKSETWGGNRTWALVDKRTFTQCNYGAVVSEPWGFQLYYNDPNVSGAYFEISAYFPLPTTNEFHHFAGTYRQVDAGHIELKTYLDGALVHTDVLPGNLANTVNNMALSIGSARAGADGGADHTFQGIIDEVSLYNRALSAEEVHAIYLADSAGKCPPPPPPPPPPPTPAADFDLSHDFSTTQNPAGAWSYGWSSALDGSFNVLPQVFTSSAQNGVPLTFWAKNNSEPAVVFFNNSSVTAISDNGQGVYPPGTVWFYAGPEGHVDNYAVIRFVAPSNGTYRLETAVRSHVDGDLSGDTDFHVLKNGTEVFGQFLPPRSGTGYTNNSLALVTGDRIDFAIGRGQDGQLHGSGLKIQATLRSVGEPPPPPGECAPIPRRGMVSWWRGEGNANDSVGLNHGQLRNGVSFAPGKVGQGFLFDGVNDFVFIPDNPTLDLTNEITMEMWFKSEAWGNGLTYALVDKRTYNDCNYGAVVSEPWGFQLYYNDPNIFGGDQPGNIHEISSYYPLPTLHVFHHFAGTYRQADANHIELKTYLDGALVQTRLFLGNLRNTVNNQAVVIGNANGGTGTSFLGVIDEVTLYNRVLSAAEIAAIYRADSAGKCPVPTENTGPTANIALWPQFTVEGAPHPFVIACDGHTAQVTLDARGSTDPDGDPLSFAWFEGGSQTPFSTAPVVTTAADVGVFSVTLRVSDAQSSANATVTFEVITPSEAAAQLSLMLEAADLSRKDKGPLQESIRAAIHSLDKGKIKTGINQLEAFEHKVQAQLGSGHPGLAASLSAATEALIDALENCPKHGGKGGDDADDD